MGCIFLLTLSCNTRKFLDQDEVLLTKNRIQIEGKEIVPSKSALEYQLSSLINQRPNEKGFFFFKPKLWYHFKIKNTSDTTGFQKFILKNNLSEAPSYFQEDLMENTVERMTAFLFDQGYFEAKVEARQMLGRKNQNELSIVYEIQLGKLFKIGEHQLNCYDEELQTIIDSVENESFLVEGEILSNDIVDLEKKRIISTLQNIGYADFNSSHFSRQLSITDTTGGFADFTWSVLEPANENAHDVKTVGQVNLLYNPTTSLGVFPRQETIDSINFLDFSTRNNKIRTRALLRFIYLRPGDVYRRRNEVLTRSALGLPTFRSVQVNKKTGSTPNEIDFAIGIYPQKKISTEYEIEINSNVRNTPSQVRNNFFGLTTGFNITDNNFLGGFERFSNGLSLNLEIGQGGRLVNSVNLNLNSNLEQPRFADYLGVYRALNRAGFLTDQAYDRMQLTANSIMSSSVEFVKLINWYSSTSAQLSYGFKNVISRPDRRISYDIVNPSLTYFNPQTEPLFDDTYEGQTVILNSFRPNLFSSFLLNQLNYVVEKPGNNSFFASRYIYNVELSGLEIYLAELISNGSTSSFKLGELEFAKFAKSEIDARFYREISRSNSFVLRANIGVAFPFGASKNVPYIKQFFLGGPNNMRAWNVRELGPGGFQDTVITRLSNENVFFDKTGDFKLLFNVEYRFDIFWILEGALFIDAGNVWNLNDDPARSNDFLTWKFLNQMAIGSGAGLRFDASYVKFVFDLGVKLRNPYPNENGSNWVFGANLPNRELLNLNFTINYPF